MEQRTPEFWKKLIRFVCVGGMIHRNRVSGHRLAELYDLKKTECLTVESNDDPRLIGFVATHWSLPTHDLLGMINLNTDRNLYTFLRPVENNPGTRHTAEGYGFPHIDVPMTRDVMVLIDRLNAGGWTDFTGMSILADALQEADYNDPRFPWILDALRDENQAPYIDKRIWHGVLHKNTLSRLMQANEQAKETFKREMEAQRAES